MRFSVIRSFAVLPAYFRRFENLTRPASSGPVNRYR
jgi:hypothetical protein